MPESMFDEYSTENELEVTGGDVATRLALPGELREFSAGEKELVGDGGAFGASREMEQVSTGFKDWEEGAVARREIRSRWRPRRGGWRRALVMSELFAVPATMRRKGSFPGPPLGLL